MAAFVCENCGAPLDARLGLKVVKCSYCGSVQAIVIPEEECSDEITKHYNAAMACLEKKQWKKAKEIADRLTIMADGNRLPCILFMMLENKLDKEEKLGKLSVDLADSAFYNMIMEDGSDALKAKVEAYRVSSFGNYCDKIVNSSYIREELEKVAQILKEYPDIKNAAALSEKCEKVLAMLDSVGDEIEYIKDRLSAMPAECRREGRSKYKDKLRAIADHCRWKFKDCAFAPLVVYLPDDNSLLSDGEGTTYVVSAGYAKSEPLFYKSAMKFVLLLADKRTDTIVVWGDYSSKMDEDRHLAQIKDVAVRFQNDKMAVCNIKPTLFGLKLVMEYI